MLKLNGIYTPLPTSFDSAEELSVDKIKENIKELSKYELSGFLVLGSNGELVNLNDKEREQVYQAAREAIPPEKAFLAGTGCQSTRQTIELTKKAANAGADAAVVLNPFYYKGLMTKEALKSHYFAIADAATIPIIIYNMPANSGLDMDADTIKTLSNHKNILGLKDSGGNITKMGEIKTDTESDFQVLAGSAGFLLPALSVGAKGGILALSNIAPQECIDLYKSFMEGKIQEARKIQLRIIKLNNAVTRKWGIPALKEAMNYKGLYGGPARQPLLPVNGEVKEKIHNLMKGVSNHT
ncbi:MAG: dihydrodipicolinate synthase family protein [Bacteroidales bacterium]